MKRKLCLSLFSFGLAFLLSGCGQTGPLYLPKPTAGKQEAKTPQSESHSSSSSKGKS